MRRDTTTYRLAAAGVCGAITLLLTWLGAIPIPMPGGVGYLNLGDAGVLLSACLLANEKLGIGGKRAALYAAAAAGIGSALADVLAGFALYAPVTFAVKGLLALGCVLLLCAFPRKLRALALLLPAPIVPLGYLCYELLLYGNTALANVPANALQVLVGAVLAYAASAAFSNPPKRN